MKLTTKQRQVLEFVQSSPAQIAHLQDDSLVMHHSGSGDCLKHVGLSVAQGAEVSETRKHCICVIALTLAAMLSVSLDEGGGWVFVVWALTEAFRAWQSVRAPR